MKLRTVTMHTRPADQGRTPIRRTPLGLRFRTRLHRRSLDQALAAGCPATARGDRALRARQLVSPRTRRMLARSLRRAVADSARPQAMRLSSAVRPDPGSVFGWREGLLGVADRLDGPEPVNPRGVARVILLLTEGAGPLYSPNAPRSLASAIWSIADGLRPCPPHEWDCPKVMKLDPEHVTWTCRRCGVVATSDDLAVRPA